MPDRGFMGPGMPRGRRIALGLATAWPFVWFVLITIPFLVFAVSRPTGEHDDDIIAGFVILALGHFLTAGLVLILIVIYLVHVFRNPRLDREKQWLWVALVVGASVLVLPVYWYVHVWREPEVAAAAPA